MVCVCVWGGGAIFRPAVTAPAARLTYLAMRRRARGGRRAGFACKWRVAVHSHETDAARFQSPTAQVQ